MTAGAARGRTLEAEDFAVPIVLGMSRPVAVCRLLRSRVYLAAIATAPNFRPGVDVVGLFPRPIPLSPPLRQVPESRLARLGKDLPEDCEDLRGLTLDRPDGHPEPGGDLLILLAGQTHLDDHSPAVG